MSNQIIIPRTAGELASKLRSVVDTLEDISADLDSLKAAMDQVAASSDWASLATVLGCSAADAEAVYNLVGSVVAGPMADVFLAQLVSRLQYGG